MCVCVRERERERGRASVCVRVRECEREAGVLACSKRFRPSDSTGSSTALQLQSPSHHQLCLLLPCKLTRPHIYIYIFDALTAAERKRQNLSDYEDFYLNNGSSQGQNLAWNGALYSKSIGHAVRDLSHSRYPAMPFRWIMTHPFRPESSLCTLFVKRG